MKLCSYLSSALVAGTALVSCSFADVQASKELADRAANGQKHAMVPPLSVAPGSAQKAAHSMYTPKKGHHFHMSFGGFDSRLRKRATYYITTAGYVTTDQLQATVFFLNNGQLRTSGVLLSADPSDPYIPFAANASNIRSITTTWTNVNGLSWNNANFTYGAGVAQYCQGSDSRVYIIFTAKPAACNPVLASPVPTPTQTPQMTSSGAITSSSSAASSAIASSTGIVSSTPSPAPMTSTTTNALSSSAVSTSTSTPAASASAAASSTSIISSSSAATALSSTSSSILPLISTTSASTSASSSSSTTATFSSSSTALVSPALTPSSMLSLSSTSIIAISSSTIQSSSQTSSSSQSSSQTSSSSILQSSSQTSSSNAPISSSSSQVSSSSVLSSSTGSNLLSSSSIPGIITSSNSVTPGPTSTTVAISTSVTSVSSSIPPTISPSSAPASSSGGFSSAISSSTPIVLTSSTSLSSSSNVISSNTAQSTTSASPGSVVSSTPAQSIQVSTSSSSTTPAASTTIAGTSSSVAAAGSTTSLGIGSTTSTLGTTSISSSAAAATTSAKTLCSSPAANFYSVGTDNYAVLCSSAFDITYGQSTTVQSPSLENCTATCSQSRQSLGCLGVSFKYTTNTCYLLTGFGPTNYTSGASYPYYSTFLISAAGNTSNPTCPQDAGKTFYANGTNDLYSVRCGLDFGSGSEFANGTYASLGACALGCAGYRSAGTNCQDVAFQPSGFCSLRLAQTFTGGAGTSNSLVYLGPGNGTLCTSYNSYFYAVGTDNYAVACSSYVGGTPIQQIANVTTLEQCTALCSQSRNASNCIATNWNYQTFTCQLYSGPTGNGTSSASNPYYATFLIYQTGLVTSPGGACPQDSGRTYIGSSNDTYSFRCYQDSAGGFFANYAASGPLACATQCTAYRNSNPSQPCAYADFYAGNNNCYYKSAYVLSAQQYQVTAYVYLGQNGTR